MESKVKDEELNRVQGELLRKEEEIVRLQSKLELIDLKGAAPKEEMIKCLVDERTRALSQLKEMEKGMYRQQGILYMLRKQLEEMESGSADNEDALRLDDRDGEKFLKWLAEMCLDDQGMKSMELDMGDQQPIHDIMEIRGQNSHNSVVFNIFQQNSHNSSMEENVGFEKPEFPKKVCLSTVFERDDEGEDGESVEEEVDKEVVEESIGHNFACLLKNQTEDWDGLLNLDDGKDSDSTRIENISMLCDYHRELAQQERGESTANSIPSCLKRGESTANSIACLRTAERGESSANSMASLKTAEREESKENIEPIGVETTNVTTVYVKPTTTSHSLLSCLRIPGELLFRRKRKL